MTVCHRLNNKRFFALYTKQWTLFEKIPADNWSFSHDTITGTIAFTFRPALVTTSLKIHCLFDDRDSNYAIADLSQFRFLAGTGVKVFLAPAARTETYEYDARGNRSAVNCDLPGRASQEYKYYHNSDRLLTDGEWAFVYDANGNMIEKGNRFETLNYSNPTVHYLQTSDAIHWEYGYDCLNRLVSVAKNGTIVARYLYDPTGLRIAKLAADVTVREVYDYDLGGNLIYQKTVANDKVHSYVWAFGRLFARVDGVIGSAAAKYFYHDDQVGSPMVITDEEDGQIVWRGDHTPFGEKFADPCGDWQFSDDVGFTGKDWDAETGLWYFNARWYDPELGRFVEEDSIQQGLNWYGYCHKE